MHRVLTKAALTLSVLAFVVTPVLAADDTHGGDSHAGPSYDLLTVDVGTAIWTIIIFLILMVILRAAAWKPIQGMLSQRERFIADSLASAKRDREEAERVLADYMEQVAKAKDEATAIVEEGRKDAEVLRRKIEDQARDESQKISERAKAEVKLATDNAIKEIFDVSGKLAMDIASRIMRKELNAQEHERLINESIDELKSKVEQN